MVGEPPSGGAAEKRARIGNPRLKLTSASLLRSRDATRRHCREAAFLAPAEASCRMRLAMYLKEENEGIEEAT